MKNWLKYYESIVAIRDEYANNQYKQPPIFKQEIPGLDLYQKYEEFVQKKHKSKKAL